MPAKALSSPRRAATAAASSDRRHLAARRVVWFVGLFIWAAWAASMVSFNPADPPSHAVAPLNPAGGLTNWLGPVGAFVAYHTVLMIGSGAWIILACAGVYLALVAFRGTVTHAAVRAIGVVMVALAFSGYHALLMPGVGSMPEGGGGLVAIVGVHELAQRFGSLGAALWITLMGIVGLTVAFDDWFAAVPRALSRPLVAAAAGLGLLRRGGVALAGLAGRPGVRDNDVDDDSGLRAVASRMKQPVVGVAEDEDGEDAGEALGGAPEGDEEEEETGPRGRSAKPAPSAPVADDDDEEEAEEEEYEEEGAEDAADDGGEEDEEEDEAGVEGAGPGPASFDPDRLREKIARLPVLFAGSERRAATQEDLDQLREGRIAEDADARYVFPGLDLLIDPEAGYEDALEQYIREQATALETALHTYNIKGEVAGIESGPVITLYQVRLAPGTKVSAITAVSSDIARALRSVNIRVVPNTEGLDTVGIEVPNRKKEKVRLKELMTRSDATGKMKLPLFLGKDASGRPLVTDLATLPHMLIAGTTGSGKSVCMNAIIMGFLYTQKPSDMKLVLVDPKVVELSQFKDIPHLMCPVVTDMSKAAAILEWAVGKMDERYELLAEAGCRDITAYNSLSWEEKRERFNPQSEAEEARIPRNLPYMVFIIDELADLMMTNKEVEGSIVRIAQKARAVGIHLILATQRPQANVVTGLIKSNMPGRLCFKVASGMDSRIVLDQKGGELLLGQGDMLFITPRSATPMRAQGTLVDDSEIRNVVRFVRNVSGPSFERQLVQLRGPVEPGSEEHEQRMLENAQEDPLFDRAVEIVLETKRGSVSLLQRRLAIGYTRASRLIELMGMAGIIGDHKGSVAREVCITIEEWEAMKRQAQIDAEAARSAPAARPGEGAQSRLFPEPVTAREITATQQTARRDGAAADDLADAPVRGVHDPAPVVVGMVDEDEDQDEGPAATAARQSDAAIAGGAASEQEEETLIDGAAIEEEEEEEIGGADEIEDEIEDSEEDEEEEEEGDDELVDEASEDEGEEDEDGEDGEEEGFEYEYEYVEVDDPESLSDEYEIVDEAPPPGGKGGKSPPDAT